ncbi:MAG: MBL fold metallo-hydrolase RNA specificity domain-containing protein [Anaerolineae bacterium]|nr:MBL fold metallo-hydrolase RNA specificity domain-containing protein [Anaerolineae bacterium]
MKRFELGKLSIDVFGGWKEIGGNQILLSSTSGSLLLDFGKSFGRWNRYFTEFLGPRSGFGIRDLLFLNLLPPLPGLYRDTEHDTVFVSADDKALLSMSGLDGERVLGLLLSHAHLDHTGAIAYLRSDLPIVTSAATAAIIKAMQDTGQAGLDGEIAYLSARGLSDEGLLLSQGDSYQRRPLHLVHGQVPQDFAATSPAKTKKIEGAPWSEFAGKLGPFEVEAFPVDHSVPGAVAFGVHTEEGLVVYTGDLRRHGRWAQKTEAFIQTLSQREVSLLIIEGTRLGRSSKTYTEHQVRDALRNLIAQHPKAPVVVDFAPRNLERMLSCMEVGRDLKRTLVITPKDAYLLLALSEVDQTWKQLLGDVLVIKEKRVRRPYWEEIVWNNGSVRPVGLEEVASHPDGFLLAFGFFELNRLIDLRLAEERRGVAGREGIYVFSNSYWADDEQVLDLQVLLNWLKALNFRVYPEALNRLPRDPSLVDNPYHTSGHAPTEDLVDLVRQVRPRYLLPVHTEAAHRWRKLLKGEQTKVLLAGKRRR